MTGSDSFISCNHTPWTPCYEIWRRLSKPLVIVLASATMVLVGLYIIYRLVDPLPPHRLVIAAGIAGTTYDDFARQYARILARHGVALEVRNYAGAVEHFDLLRDSASGVQAAITTFGFAGPAMRRPSIRLVEYPTHQYSSFTEPPSPSRHLHSSAASVYPSGCQQPPCERSCCRF